MVRDRNKEENMAKDFLRPIYENVYGEKFNATSFESRMEMQKMIFIMQEAGIRVGDYDFLWFKHGPYSQGLQDDILTLSGTKDAIIKYSVDAKDIIDRIKNVFNKEVAYSRSAWVECLASLQYIKANIYSLNASDDDIINELMKRKPHLNNKELNEEALRGLEYILG